MIVKVYPLAAVQAFKRSSVQASISTLAVTPAQEGGRPPAAGGVPQGSSKQGHISRFTSTGKRLTFKFARLPVTDKDNDLSFIHDDDGE
jgi:hypothetical protein